MNSSELDLLSKGLNFVPTPKTTNLDEIKNSISEFVRSIKVQYAAVNLKFNSSKLPFTGKSNWQPSSALLDPDLLESLEELYLRTASISTIKEKNNLTTEEYRAFKTLKKQSNLVFKPADKGGQIVIMDKQEYIEEGLRQLNVDEHYQKLESPIFQNTIIRIQEILTKLKNENFINNKQLKYLSPEENCRERRLYLLPKIHKSMDKWTKPDKMPPGRPIISDCGSESYKISEYIDFYLHPLATDHPAYLKDTQDFLTKIRNLHIPQNSMLITMDVDSLYTNIDNNSGLSAVKEKLNQSQDTKVPKQYLLELLEISLTKNDFEFNGEYFLQTWGTAMGKKFAPNYANIFMAKWESEALIKCPQKPMVYLRYLDDIFIIWEHGEDNFWKFYDILNSHAKSIKLKATINQNSIDFLDVTVFKGPAFTNTGILDTKVYFKPTDTHDLLHKKSHHPKHTFKGILKSQIIRFYRNCTREEDFQEACTTLFRVLRTRGYSKRFLRQVKNSTLTDIKTKENYDRNSMITTCNSGHCKTCKYISTGSTFKIGDKTYKCFGQLNCDSRNIIYSIKCKKCELAYIGETGNSLRDRFNQHKSDIAHYKNTPVANHFNLPQHSLLDLTLAPLEQIQHSENEDNTRKIREQNWIEKTNSLQPFGLNLKQNKFQSNILPLVIPYSSTASKLVQDIKQTYNSIQQSFPSHFPNRLVTAYQRNPNIKHHLVHSKLRQ